MRLRHILRDGRIMKKVMRNIRSVRDTIRDSGSNTALGFTTTLPYVPLRLVSPATNLQLFLSPIKLCEAAARTSTFPVQFGSSSTPGRYQHGSIKEHLGKCHKTSLTHHHLPANTKILSPTSSGIPSQNGLQILVVR